MHPLLLLYVFYLVFRHQDKAEPYVKKQLELNLDGCNPKDVKRYMDEVQLHAMTVFLGESHPKVKAARKRDYSQ